MTSKTPTTEAELREERERVRIEECKRVAANTQRQLKRRYYGVDEDE